MEVIFLDKFQSYAIVENGRCVVTGFTTYEKACEFLEETIELSTGRYIDEKKWYQFWK